MRHHVLIAGTGRAGTTFLVQYLTACGLETELTRNPGAKLHEHANAGLEGLPVDGAPYVVKQPWLFEFVDRLLNQDDVQVDAVIIPMRDIVEAASSRVTLELRDRLERTGFQEEVSQWETWAAVPGGIVYSLNPIDQARILAMGFHRVVHACVRRGIPVVFLDFPRFVEDAVYLYRQLAPVIGRFVDHDAAVEAHGRVARPELVRTGKELAQRSDEEFPSHAALDRAALFRELRHALEGARQAGEEARQARTEAELARQRVAALERRVTVAHERASSPDSSLRSLQQEIADKQRALDEAASRIEKLEAALSKTAAACDAIVSSTTWRMTYPLRLAVSALLRRGKS